jgi:hypothetical protein
MNADTVMRERFPIQLFVFAFQGWTFDFYDLVLIGFIKNSVAADLHLTHTTEAIMLSLGDPKGVGTCRAHRRHATVYVTPSMRRSACT